MLHLEAGIVLCRLILCGISGLVIKCQTKCHAYMLEGEKNPIHSSEMQDNTTA